MKTNPTRLYRAVSQLELEDIGTQDGRLRDSRNMSSKGFSYERGDAIAFGLQAKAYDSSPYFLISVDVPDAVVLQGIPHVAACEGPGVCLREEELALLTDLKVEAPIG